MTVHPLPDDPRLTALLAENATEGLDSDESRELSALLEEYADVDADELARPAAALQIAALARSGRLEPMPRDLRQRLDAAADEFFAAPARSNVVQLQRPAAADAPPGERRRRDWAGWATAAALLVALIAVYDRAPDPQPTVAEQRADLIATTDDTVVIAWAPSQEDGYQQVSGDVVWSDRQQRGFLRFVGLTANDPERAQYQLWIIDPERDARPVDGGVFDVPTGSSEVVVAIDAKLAVARPTAFAVTLEQPGGVVVSDGPLLIVAPTG
jgi:anti-sigma-K factor RskA